MKAKVLNGIDQLEKLDYYIGDKRVALVTGGASITRNLEQAVDVLASRYNVRKLFNTIYGIRGEFIYGEHVEQYTDEKTGLLVESIFNRKLTAPSKEMLDQVDVVIYDIKEAGTRYYEYLYCLANLMKACARDKKHLVVLDRVNPINGITVEGTVCSQDMHTMIGDYCLATRTGMTTGEFANYVNTEFGISVDLTVIPVEGWKRQMYMDDTDLLWVLPSPSLPHVNANILYTGMCIFEGISSINEGRGTSKPFELIGAPWMDAEQITRRMNRRNLPGVAFSPVHYIPRSSKYKDKIVFGVQTHILCRNVIEPFRIAVNLFDEIQSLHANEIVFTDCNAGHDVKEGEGIQFTRYFDKLLGTDALSTGRMDGDTLIDYYAEAREDYIRRKMKYHLYE